MKAAGMSPPPKEDDARAHKRNVRRRNDEASDHPEVVFGQR